MFEAIIRHHLDRGNILPGYAHRLRNFAARLEAQSDSTKRKLSEIVGMINHGTVQRNQKGEYPYLELSKDMGMYNFILYMEFGDNGLDLDRFYPVMDVDLEEPLDELEEQETTPHYSTLSGNNVRISPTTFFYVWISSLWQEVNGQRCGLNVFFRENNSSAHFSLVDFLDEYSSDFVKQPIEYFGHIVRPMFSRPLNTVELFMRASHIGYPFNSYANYWRYFEKDEHFIEIASYEFATGLRTGSIHDRLTPELDNVVQHESPSSAFRYIADFTNQAIRNGWEEMLRPPGLPERMHKKAYDFRLNTGVGWFERNERDKRLELGDILNFEMSCGLKLPDALVQYIRLFNGRQDNKHYMRFPIDDADTVHVKYFYTLEQLQKLARSNFKEDKGYLWIGELEDDSLVGVSINASDDQRYGKMAIKTSQNVRDCQYSFELFARYAH